MGDGDVSGANTTSWWKFDALSPNRAVACCDNCAPPSPFDGRNQGEARVESKLLSGEQGEGGRPSSMVFTLATAAFGWRLKMTVAVKGKRRQWSGWSRGGPPATMGSIFGEIRQTVAELLASASAARGGERIHFIVGGSCGERERKMLQYHFLHNFYRKC
jgi:hypothetical protein